MTAKQTEEALAGNPAGAQGLAAWRNLLKAHSTLMRRLDRELVERHDFTIGDYDVLAQLENAPGQRRRMCELAEAVVLSPSGLSRRVDRLERAGLVRRQRSADDGRNVETALTPAGKRLFRRLSETHFNGVRNLFANRYDESELETIADLLGRISEEPPQR